MVAGRHQYEHAIEAYLRASRVPFVSIRDVRRAQRTPEAFKTLKSFDFVLYGPGTPRLLEIKGRRVPEASGRRSRPPRTESWVTLDDVESLRAWGTIFGTGFCPTFTFIYHCPDPDSYQTFSERFELDGRLYGLRTIDLDEYTGAMTTRSPKWRTVHLPAASFDRLHRPLLRRMDTSDEDPSTRTLFSHPSASTGGTISG